MKQDFPVLSGCTYLDTASSGILTQPLFQWRQAHDKDFLMQGSAFRSEQLSFLDGVRTSLSRFFNAPEESTFLIPNFSFGFNSLLRLLSPKHSFLLLKDDYPSLLNPLQTAGFRVAEVEVDRDIQTRLYAAIRKYKPTVFAFSLVQYISGFKLGLEVIRAIKRDFPDLLLLADGTQCCGTEVIDFRGTGLDMLGASGYKWMLAGYGNGFMLFSDQLMSVLNREHLATAMEPGHLDTLNFGSLKESINYLEVQGMAAIQNKINELSRAALKAFSEMRLLSAVASEKEFHSQIFNLNISRAMHRRLLSENVVCIERGSGTRVGFHFFNDEKDFERLLGILRAGL